MQKIIRKYRKGLSILFIAIAGAVTISAMTAVKHRIFTIGDSTVQDYADGWAPRKGWGQMFQAFFSNADVQVINKAVGGTSSRSFYNSFWSGVKNEMKSGDYLFIQFGINDRAADAARRAVGEDFKNFLRSYVNEARAMGVIPVLVSTARRDAWSNGLPYDSYHEHPQLVREVAAELNVPLIDLDAKLYNGMVKATNPYTTRFWSNTYPPGEYPNYPNGNTDQVHFQEMGAIQLAKYVVEEIKRLGSNSPVGPLIPFLKPQYPVTVMANYPEAGLITMTETYPEGLNIHVKALVNTGHKFINWKDQSGKLITTKNLFQFTMGAGPRNYVAYFDDEIPIKIDCNGTVNGSATLDNCGICTGGTTGKSPCSGAIQGEYFCTIDGVFEAINTGFIGSGYANFTNAVGSFGKYSIYSESGGNAVIGIRFANGSAAARAMTVSVNGTNQTTFTGEPTGAWTIWKTVTITLNLAQGPNMVQFTSTTADGGPNIDLMVMPNATVFAGNCTKDCNGVFGGIAFTDECGTCVGGNTGKEACTQDCEGNWGGSAYLDDCHVCIGATNGNVACTGFIEAETACSVDGILLEDKNAGFSGAGYVNADNILGAGATWTLYSDAARTVTLGFRYANSGAVSRDGSLRVNGSSAGTLVLPVTGAWTNWEVATIEVDFQEGVNEISLTALTTDGLANIDLISFSEGVMEVGCIITGMAEVESSGPRLFPNPTDGVVHLSSPADWELYDAIGTLLLTETQSSSVDLGNYAQGVYVLKVNGVSYKIVKK